MNIAVETHSDFVKIGPAKLYYETAGHGAAVVLLHAGVADRRMWDDQFLALAQSYRVIRYDRRGFGRSESAAAPFSHHGDLAALLTALDVEQAHLVGCSQGGEIALDFALAYPGRVLSLGLVSSSIGGFEPAGLPPQRVLDLIGALQQGDLDQAAELAAQIWLDGPQRSPAQTSAVLRDRVRQMAGPALVNFGPNPHQQPLDPPAVTHLAELQAPSLVVVGALDDPLMATMAAQLAAEIARARKVVLPNAAHFPNMEQPAAFNQLLLDFLAQL